MPTLAGTGKCRYCSKKISGNKDRCRACADNPRPAPTGCLEILNVQGGDTKLTFDKDNPAECIRAARIVTDMLRRGYALLVEVETDGVKKYQRVLEFRPDRYEYVIADFDPMVAAAEDAKEQNNEEVEQAGASPAAAFFRR